MSKDKVERLGEVKCKVAMLRHDILNLIYSFEEATGLTVFEINPIHTEEENITTADVDILIRFPIL